MIIHTTRIGTIDVQYHEAYYSEGEFVVSYDDPITGSVRHIYPRTGGCWDLLPDGTRGLQLEGKRDVRVPRDRSKWRTFVRRCYAGLE